MSDPADRNYKETGMSKPEELGGYRLERLLGRGTMGSVYLARRSDAPDDWVAIKRVPSLGTEDDRSRLRREAETMASLSHPNIIRVLDVVDDADSIALVMPYAEGGTLADRIKTHRGMAPDDVRHFVAPIADALAAAHAQGVLHRDVKPSNILFTAQGEPLLADFGIARNARTYQPHQHKHGHGNRRVPRSGPGRRNRSESVQRSVRPRCRGLRGPDRTTAVRRELVTL